MLIPGAYKADLWRLCVLYIHGGIYGDLTQTFLREYNVNKDNADIILVRDRPYGDHSDGIYNAFMAAKKRNGFIQYCIEQIVKQILMRNKGRTALDITGPQALRRHYLTFFHVNRINFGLQTLRGIDNKIYRINIPFRHAEPEMCKKHSTECCLELNHTCIFLRKIKNHNKLLYNVKNIHYAVLYKQNKIFKRSKYGGAANGSLQTHQRQKFHFYFSRLK
jgi:mannosyltransferase OCH1-like enzyme